MKKFSLILLFSVSLVLLASVYFLIDSPKTEAKHLAAPACSGYYGKFTATNWPKGKKATITCQGAKRQVGQCIGESKTLAPGESFDLSHCNCLDKATKCIAVTGLPAGCTMKTKLACAANRQSIASNFNVTCSATPSPSGSATPSSAATTAPEPTPTLTPTPTPTPTPEPSAAPAAEAAITPNFECLGSGNINCKEKKP